MIRQLFSLTYHHNPSCATTWIASRPSIALLLARTSTTQILTQKRNVATTTTKATTTTIEDEQQEVFTKEDYFDHSNVSTSQQMKNMFKDVHRLGELTAKAQTLLRLGRYHPAISCYKEILELQPDNLSARINVATIHHQHLHQYKSAIEQYELIIQQMKEEQSLLEEQQQQGRHSTNNKNSNNEEEEEWAVEEQRLMREHQDRMLLRTIYQLADCHKRLGQSTKAVEYCDEIESQMNKYHVDSATTMNEIDAEFMQNVKELKQSVLNPL